MTTPEISPRDVRRVQVVNRYATPFAILLVALAIFLPSPIRSVRIIGLSLLAFSILFNLVTVGLIRRRPEILPRLKKLRLYTNLAVNVVLVYELSPYWPPIWLLLVLTPIATAIYASARQSLMTSLLIAFLIMGIHLVHGGGGLMEWGQTLSRAAFVVLLSLLLNELAHEAGLNSPRNQP
ncbi:MAG TPA: hypothetical protein P5079_04390 [Elusimicrobiota bacterium]|nr:hypothetical protein [Elusimicrobiota bacterium]